MSKCKHDWKYPRNIIQGRKLSEIAIVRYCETCGLKQVAFISSKLWQTAKGDYLLNNYN